MVGHRVRAMSGRSAGRLRRRHRRVNLRLRKQRRLRHQHLAGGAGRWTALLLERSLFVC